MTVPVLWRIFGAAAPCTRVSSGGQEVVWPVFRCSCDQRSTETGTDRCHVVCTERADASSTSSGGALCTTAISDWVMLVACSCRKWLQPPSVVCSVASSPSPTVLALRLRSSCCSITLLRDATGAVRDAGCKIWRSCQSGRTVKCAEAEMSAELSSLPVPLSVPTEQSEICTIDQQDRFPYPSDDLKSWMQPSETSA